MGSKSSSTSNQKYSTTYVNTTDTNLLNENVNNFVSDTVNTQAKNCSASISQIQNIDISGIKLDEGDFTLEGTNQNQTSGISFDCVQVSEFQNDIGSGVLTKYMDAIQNSFSTDAIDKMEATAASNAKNSMGGTGSADASSKTNVDYSFNNTNTTKTNIENVVKNAISNHLTLESINNCTSEIHNSQSVKITDVTLKNGSVKLGVLSQTQGADMMTKCMQSNSDTNKVTNAVASELGVTLDSENKQTKTTDIKTTSTSEATNLGVGDAANQFFTGIGNMMSGIFSGMMGPLLIVCVIIIILVVVGGIISYVMNQKEDGSGMDFGALAGKLKGGPSGPGSLSGLNSVNSPVGKKGINFGSMSGKFKGVKK